MKNRLKLNPARVASTGYIGLRHTDAAIEDKKYTLQDLVGPQSHFQFDLVTWAATKTVPVIDDDGRITVILVAPPQTDDWKACAQAATNKLEKERHHCRFTAEQSTHRRGVFPALSTGIFFGNGMTQPANASHNKKNTAVLRRLTNYWAFQRMSGFVTGMMKVHRIQ
ncbi:hypothetical protein FB446DRAFT_794122 [Lentinula raphanica]|nr:hypothetical protein FB446DRAFT_794122 [Lentinula raphanica]